MDLWTHWKSTALYSWWTWLLITMKRNSSQLLPRPPGSEWQHVLLTRSLHKDIPSERKGARLLACNLAARGSIWCHLRTAFCWHLVILLQDFAEAGGTGLSWRGLAGVIYRLGCYSKIFLTWAGTHWSVGFKESLIQKKLSRTQSRLRELQCLFPFTHAWIAKGFLKTIFSPLLNCY